MAIAGRAQALAEHPRFEDAIKVIIVANAVAVAGELMWQEHGELFAAISDGILAIYVVELLIRLTAHSWNLKAFGRSRWNVIDSVIVIIALVPWIGDGVMVLRMARFVRLLHLSRLAQLRLVDLFKRKAVAH
jgi:voltage-gated sodium channel